MMGYVGIIIYGISIEERRESFKILSKEFYQTFPDLPAPEFSYSELDDMIEALTMLKEKRQRKASEGA